MHTVEREIELLDVAIKRCKNVKDTGAINEALYSLFVLFPVGSDDYAFYYGLHVSLVTEEDKKKAVSHVLRNLTSRKNYLLKREEFLF